ncbi:AzlC family ABC transporter permease [Lachnospiraceae bacterium oral taxon 096]|nr:AzlC family ABC transporter permease [Lachnospiraceae bacterium oral taxon 096]
MKKVRREMITERVVQKAFLRSLPVFAGYIVLGIGFGILAKSKGYGIWWALAMSLLIYGGSMQYVGIDLMGAGASVLSVAIMSLMVQARHLFYAISMIDKLKGAGRKKPYLIFAMTDETYSLIVDDDGPKNEDRFAYYFMIAIFNHIYWIFGGCIGSLLASVISFNTTGIDFSMTALFVTVFTDQWLKSKNHIYACTGVFCSLGSLLIFGASNFLIPAMLSIVVVMGILYQRRKIHV